MSAPAIARQPPVAGRRVVLLTGLSGAGISTALKALEDLGHEAVDNLPLTMIPALIDDPGTAGRPLALSIDSRTRHFDADRLMDSVARLRARPDIDARLVFIDCDDEILQRRYTETRRRHPLAIDRPMPDGIRMERQLLSPVRDGADLVIDSSSLNLHDLRRLVGGHFATDPDPALSVFVTSFSFRRGLPREADLVFDVRFLDNPHWDPALRPLSGLDAPVQQAIERDADFARFLDGVTTLLGPLLPRYNREGKSYLTVAVGCSGGRHRSVHVAEKLASWLRRQRYKVGLTHRDL